MAENGPIAAVRGLRKTYENLTAVDGVSFEIQPGEIFGLLGPNGAGKTTTISILAGILPPTEGEVMVAGYDARRASIPMKRALGMVPQELAIYLKLSGRENLAFFGQLYGLKGDALETRIQEMLQLVGLTERADDQAANYSGGMKRRLNLAVGLMHDPQLLLLDEPTVGVDPQSRNHIFEGVRTLNRQGLTILYTSHYMEEVEALCDRVGIMDHGKLIACDTVPNLIARLGGAVIEIGIAATDQLDSVTARLGKLDLVKEVEAIPVSESEADSHAFTLRVRAEQPNRVLPGLVTTLSACDVPLLSLTIREPNLEDVFLTLTGKTLRD